MQPMQPNLILIIISNPVDVLTTFAQKLSGLPRNQVIGSGTLLDTMRLNAYLSERLSIASSSINAYVLGEHGDSQFCAWSIATVGGVKLVDLPEFQSVNRQECASFVRNKAAKIIDAKGSTYYGIASCVRNLCETILFSTSDFGGQIKPVSHWIEELGVCLSFPAVLGRRGLVRSLKPVLDEVEMAALKKSSDAMKNVISGY